MNTPGYEQLAAVLQAAFDQAAKGKGAERHANDLPFHGQRMQSISALLDSDAGMAYQVCKKVAEARGMPHDARERELLGAIVYTAGMVIYHRERQVDGDSQAPLADPVLQATTESVRRDEGFDEARADIIGQNGNDGEHYDAIEKKEDAVTFKAIAEKIEQPAPGLRRADPVRSKPAAELPNTDGLVDPTGRPAWSNVPSWVKWIGQDRNGVWTGFIAKPDPRQGRWFSTKRYIELNSGEALFGENWVHTLEERP